MTTTKRTAKKAAKMGPKKEEMKDGKGKTFIIAAVLIVLAIAAIFLLITQTAPEEEKELSEIIDDSTAAVRSLDTFKGEAGIEVGLAGESEDIFGLKMTSDVKIDYNKPEDMMFVEMTSSAGFMEQEIKIFVIGGMTYTYLPDDAGEYFWVKQEATGRGRRRD